MSLLIFLLQALSKTGFALFWQLKPSRRILVNDGFASVLVFLGVIAWTDVPHAHNLLTHTRIIVEDMVSRRFQIRLQKLREDST